jgi:hypothetical protein
LTLGTHIRKRLVNRLVVTLAVVCALMLFGAAVTGAPEPTPQRGETSDVFTPAHPSIMAAVMDFLGWRPKPVQPIAFTHKVHIEKGLTCEACHMGVDQGPDAAIPGVKFCMSCHSVIAVEKPEIKKIAAYQARGEDIPWQRVYDYSPTAHVKFNHAPHIRASVECAACHGDLSKQTVAERVVDLSMGRCLQCHEERKVSIDCLTCHI